MSALNSQFKWCGVISVSVNVSVTDSVTVDAVAVVDWERVDGSGPLRPPSLLVSLVLCLVIAVCYVYPIVLQFVYSLFTFYLDVSLLL